MMLILLIFLVSCFLLRFLHFAQISFDFHGRRQVLKPGLVKGQWSAEEDDRLVELVNKGFRNWGQVIRRSFNCTFRAGCMSTKAKKGHL